MRLGGMTELAELLDVTSQRVAKLVLRRGFPDPIAHLSAGRVWDLDAVERWDHLHRRGPGRPPGIRLGDRFELETEPIGSGGFADVYRAVDLEDPDLVVAVKILREPESKEAKKRFRRELKLLVGVDHPNVIPVIEYGMDSADRPWYAMPLAQGSLFDSLPEVAARGDEIFKAINQIGGGLSYLHNLDSPIYHRDLSPRNVLKTYEGKWAISDFGLAREALRQSTMTGSSVAFGQWLYVAPEQHVGLKHAETPADIYSLGRVLHAMVIGRDPAPGESPPTETMFRHVIRTATRQDPADRYATVDDLLEDVAAIEGVPEGPWVGIENRLERLHDRISDFSMEEDALDELQSLVLASGKDQETLHQLSMTMAHLDSDEIKYLVQRDPEAFTAMMKAWAGEVSEASYGFSFCDNLANFGRRAWSETADDEILGLVLRALIDLGANHNRWHVQGVVTGVLQQIRSRDTAVAALAGLRGASGAGLSWTLTEFAVRSLHPVLRKGITDLLG
jgi:serine/threonine protein kinase